MTVGAGGINRAAVLAVSGAGAIWVSPAGRRVASLVGGVPNLIRLACYTGGVNKPGVFAIFICAAAVAVAETGGSNALCSVP